MADIPFPFPFGQLMNILLIAFTLVVPIIAGEPEPDDVPRTGARIMGVRKFAAVPATVAFFVTVAFWSLSSISLALESPFADGPNQLPVIDMHERFIENIRASF